MNKFMKSSIVALLCIIAASEMQAYNHVLKPSQSVKNGGGSIRYGMAAVAGGWGHQTYDVNTTGQIGWDSGGMCIHTHEIQMIGGKYDGETIKIEESLPCAGSGYYIGTPEEIQQKINEYEQKLRAQNTSNEQIEKYKTLWNQSTYKGTHGKLQAILGIWD